MIDCKDDMIENSRFANRFMADQVCSLAWMLTTHDRRIEIKTEKPKQEQF